MKTTQSEPRLIRTKPQKLRLARDEKGRLIRAMLRLLADSTPEERAELEAWLADTLKGARPK